jgi:hypothetical protein
LGHYAGGVRKVSKVSMSGTLHARARARGLGSSSGAVVHDPPRVVISGTFLLGMGAQASEKLTSYAAGDYILIPAEMPHYGGAKGETVIQLHGIGPFEIILATPSTQPSPSH